MISRRGRAHGQDTGTRVSLCIRPALAAGMGKNTKNMFKYEYKYLEIMLIQILSSTLVYNYKYKYQQLDWPIHREHQSNRRAKMMEEEG